MTGLAVVELGKKAELRQMPRTALGPSEVEIKVHYSGVSVGTEMWIAFGRRDDYGPVPFINGYQASGQITEVGSDVTDFASKDWVTIFCDGSHAAYARTDVSRVHKVDPRVLREACLFVQPSVGAHALNAVSVQCGDTVLITGQGLIGQMTAQLARLRGAFVVATDVSDPRLELSRAYCADVVIDARTGPVNDQLRKILPNGAEVVIESTGFEPVLKDALLCAAQGGRFVFEGYFPGDIHFDFNQPHGKQLRAFFPCFIGPRSNREGVLRLMQRGSLKINELVTHLTDWKDSEAVYNKLFTSERDSFNGIVFDWRDAE